MKPQGRGMVKYRAFAAIPEQMKMLQDWMDVQTLPAMPDIDQQTMLQWDDMLHVALAEVRRVHLTYMSKQRQQKAEGLLHYVDEQRRELRLMTREGKVQYIPIRDVIDLQMGESER